jgi:hypothetical protein
MTRDTDGNALNGAHRRKYLLSGLLECGACGGGFTIIDATSYGCATHRSKGTCGNGHRIRRKDLERRVLDGLKHRLLAPEQVEMFTRMFQEEFNRLAAEKMQSRAEDERRLQVVQRKITSLIRAIEDGLYQPSMKERMAELEAEKSVLKRRLAAPEPSSIRFHPNLAQQYRNKVANLEKALANPATHPNTVASIRRQIERITLTPNDEGGLDIHLYGDLARILEFCEADEHKSQRPGHGRPGREVSVVAGARNHLCRTFMIRRSIHAPVIGELLYRLNVSRPVVRMMYRRHVFADPAFLTDDLLADRMRLTRQPGTRFASACFVTGGLDRFDDRAAFLAAARLVQGPILTLYGQIRRQVPCRDGSARCRGSKAGG